MRLGLFCSLVLGLSASVWADVAPPPPSEPEQVTVPVVVNHGALKGKDAGAAAKITIPRGMLPVGEAVKPVNHQPGLPGRVIIAGIVMACSIVCLPFVAKAGRGGKTVLLVLVVGGVLLGAIGALYADLIPPGGRPRPRPGPREVAKKTIIIEIVDEGDAVTLTIPK